MKTTRYVFCIMMAAMCSLGVWAQLGKRFPTENETKEWFFEFSYSLRNVLFHRVLIRSIKNGLI